MKKPLKLLSTLLLSIPLLSSCSGLFKPKTMTIEYDEEVKLHDGSMIWVHITRHYFLAGEIAHGSAYMPSNVEISWDTGFKGVGRKSVFFTSYIGLVDKYDGKWYVVGAKNNGSPEKIGNSINCNNIGVFLGTNSCMVVVDESGNFIKVNPDDIYNINTKNILYPIGIKDWGMIPSPLNKTRVSWNQKIALQKTQEERRQEIGNPYL